MPYEVLTLCSDLTLLCSNNQIISVNSIIVHVLGKDERNSLTAEDKSTVHWLPLVYRNLACQLCSSGPGSGVDIKYSTDSSPRDGFHRCLVSPETLKQTVYRPGGGAHGEFPYNSKTDDPSRQVASPVSLCSYLYWKLNYKLNNNKFTYNVKDNYYEDENTWHPYSLCRISLQRH